jgi:asparagine synthase (glutamine-hydrolysing)
MNEAAHHRGPDASDVLAVGNVGLGHTRLSIIDLTPGGAQPMSRRRCHITFNGEIYNYRELRTELIAAGEELSSQSDTEVLLVALNRWGMFALDRLRGMFAFAFLNEDEAALYLVRDRFGKKPLVYSRQDGRLLAASEAKQIHAAGGKPTQNRNAALRFLAYGELNGTAETFFEGILEVPAGHYLRVDLTSGEIELVRWYDLAKRVVQTTGTYGEACDAVRELLLTAVRRRHVADVPVGACLSGGIDSSSIVSLSATLFPHAALRTITTYSDGRGLDERRFSRAVAEKFGLCVIEVKPETQDIWLGEYLQEMGRFHDQPIAGGSQYNEYCVYKMARQQGLIVMLGGQGADEYFGGYGEFWFSAQLENLKHGRFGDFNEGLSARAEARGVSLKKTLALFLSSLWTNPRRPPIPRWLKEQPEAAARRCDGRLPFTKLSIEELTISSVPFQVHSEDRNSMRWSIESRLPFLDHELVEYVLGLPTAYKCRKGVQKSLLRDAVSELPVEVSRRKDKIGFASPDALICFSQAARIRERLAGALDRMSAVVWQNEVLDAFDRMIADGSGYDPMFFRIISLDAWQQAFGCQF